MGSTHECILQGSNGLTFEENCSSNEIVGGEGDGAAQPGDGSLSSQEGCDFRAASMTAPFANSFYTTSYPNETITICAFDDRRGIVQGRGKLFGESFNDVSAALTAIVNPPD